MLPTTYRRKNDLTNWFDDFDNFFSSALKENDSISTNFPRVDIYEDKNDYFIDADLPGLDKKDISINIENNTLTITGSREDKREEKKRGYYRLERQTGLFERSFHLGDGANYSLADAQFDKGVLKVTIPKKEEIKPKNLEIKIN